MSSQEPGRRPEASSLQRLRLGLLGGTFNPVHFGHLTMARQIRRALDFDRILFIPTGDPPHKSGRDLASAEDRYEMVRLAIGSEAGLTISDVEIRRPGKSYTIDTIRLLRQEYGSQTNFFFLIGLDAFLEFPTWREPNALLELCSFVVMNRPGTSFQELTRLNQFHALPGESLAALDAGTISHVDIPLGNRRIVCLHLTPSEISASDIRRRVRTGLSVVNLLPPTVESYILQHHLYE
ncbi:MAG: putative nicotinate-nucleotide adenylyltransferase [Nitrospira sp.]